MLLDGKPIYSCQKLAIEAQGQQITTVEGLAENGKLTKVQQAFIEKDALQCGYCTPGQIMSGLALLEEKPANIEAIREGMSGNLCRCGAYPNIVAAIAEVAGL